MTAIYFPCRRNQLKFTLKLSRFESFNSCRVFVNFNLLKFFKLLKLFKKINLLNK